MCGILLTKGQTATSRLPTLLNRIHHRGPDDQSIWSEGDIALGFVRLAINGDLIEGQQPCADGALASAFNGEIYNFKELKEKYGFKHETGSDCEIFLHMYEKFGHPENFID